MSHNNDVFSFSKTLLEKCRKTRVRVVRVADEVKEGKETSVNLFSRRMARNMVRY
jgi:hypothetical protein